MCRNQFNIPASVKILDVAPISRFHWHCKNNPGSIPKNLNVFAKKGSICVKCNVAATNIVKVQHADGNIAWMLVTDTDFMTRDHKVPQALGGSNKLDNLQPMCNTCNGLKQSAVHDSPDEIQELLECINQLKLIQTEVHNVHAKVTYEIKRLTSQIKKGQLRQ